MTTAHDRAYGALLGLAAGDASGFPAGYHRTVGTWRRSSLWSQAAEMDAAQVNKFPLPYALSAPLATSVFSATDDAEQAALATTILVRAVEGANGVPRPLDLFAAWKDVVLPQRDRYWGSVADRSAILNAAQGLTPPATGGDNPHFYDDSSVVRAVPVGILFAGDSATATEVARALATVTNDDVGVDAAGVFATAVSVLAGGGSLEAAVADAVSTIPSNSWLMRKYQLAEAILEEAGSLFAALPKWNDEVSNLEYNFGNIAAETLPLALVIARGVSSLAEGLGIANLVPKQADTMPAMVGALLGCAWGPSAIPASWRERLEHLRGVCVPSTSGAALRDLADQLLAAAQTVASATEVR